MPSSALRPLHACLGLAVAVALWGCASFDGATSRIASVVTPYQIDVVQGNFVSSEQAALLKPGMPRASVRDMLGTPLLQSLFHTDRWDYVFSFKRKGEEPQLRKVTVYFKGDLLERFEADVLPTEAEFVASLAGRPQTGAVPVLEASPEALKLFPATPKAPEPKVLPPLPASYPPLETATP